MTHQTVDPTIRTLGITTAAHDALGLPYVHGADSRRRDDADDDDGADEESGDDNDADDLDEVGAAPDGESEREGLDDDDAENESAGDGFRAAGARVMDGIDDLGF